MNSKDHFFCPMTSFSKGEVLGFTVIPPVVEIWKTPSAPDLLQDNAVIIPQGVLSTPWRKASKSMCLFFPLENSLVSQNSP